MTTLPNSKLPLIALLFLLLAVGCGSLLPATSTSIPTSAPTPTILSISGSTDIQPVLINLAQDFAAATPGYQLKVLSGSNTTAAVDGIVKGIFDMAAMNRPPTADQTAKGVKYIEIARSGLAIIVHPGVTITALTTDQVKGIFTGKYTNWSQVGGADLSILVYTRAGTGGSVQAMQTAIFGDAPLSSAAQQVNGADVVRSAVASTPGSIGYAAWPGVIASGTKVLPVALNGIKPDDPAYPISEAVGFGYLASNQPKVQPLLDWLQSKTGQAALQRYAMLAPETF